MVRPDFPRTLADFQARFATVDGCRRYLIERLYDLTTVTILA